MHSTGAIPRSTYMFPTRFQLLLLFAEFLNLPQAKSLFANDTLPRARWSDAEGNEAAVKTKPYLVIVIIPEVRRQSRTKRDPASKVYADTTGWEPK